MERLYAQGFLLSIVSWTSEMIIGRRAKGLSFSFFCCNVLFVWNSLREKNHNWITLAFQ